MEIVTTTSHQDERIYHGQPPHGELCCLLHTAGSKRDNVKDKRADALSIWVKRDILKE